MKKSKFEKYSRNDRYQKFEARWKSHLHYHLVLILTQNETPKPKFILNVVEFHMIMVLLNENVSKQAHVINKLGRFGTGAPLAPVLLFELLPSDKL